MTLPEEVAEQLDALRAAGRIGDPDAFVAEAVTQRLDADKTAALAAITALAGGQVDPVLLGRARKVLGHPEADAAPHAGAA